MITGFGNNISSSLASDITATQTSFAVMPGDGGIFSALLTTDIVNPDSPHGIYAKLTLTDRQQTVFEICHLMAVSQDTLMVIRGQEGTIAKHWSLNDVVANFATRGSEQRFVQIEQLQGGDYASAIAGGTANALAISLPSTCFDNGATEWLLKCLLLITPATTNTGSATLQVTLSGRVIGTFPLYKGNKSELIAGDLIAGTPFCCVLDQSKTFFSVINPVAAYTGNVKTVNGEGPDAAGNVQLDADDINAVAKSGDTMTGPLTTPYVASTPDVVPEGAGAYGDQLNNKAPFYQPNWQWLVNAGGIFVPVAKGVSTRQDKGYPTAISFGYLMPGEDMHAHPIIHALGDGGMEDIWDFNTQTGGLSSGKAGEFATQDWVNTAVHTNELHVGEAQMSINGDIWGTRWNPSGAWLWDAIIDQIQNIGQMSVNGTQWWAKVNLNGGTLIVQGGYAEVQYAEVTDWIPLNISVPNRLLGVYITNKNFAQGYATYNPQVTDLSGSLDGFNYVHGEKERMVYWLAVGH